MVQYGINDAMNNTVTRNNIKVDFNICLRPFLSALFMEDLTECGFFVEMIVAVDPFLSKELNFDGIPLDSVTAECFLPSCTFFSLFTKIGSCTS